MADLRGYYDPKDEASSGFEVLPAGLYTVKITNGEWKQTKSGNGEYLQLEMTVADGEHAGKVIIERLNLKNPSQEAVRIARSQFAALRQAVGVLDPKDSADLENIRFQLLLKCEKRSDDPTKMTNAVQRYIKKGETVSTPQQQSGDAPWARNAPKANETQSAAPSDVPW